MEHNSTHPLTDHQIVPQESSREVTWSLAYFWLVSLAINSMTQPSGQPCGLRCQRAYYYLAKSSPIICAFDSVDILVSWVSRICLCLETPRKAAAKVLIARFVTSSSTWMSPGAIDHDGREEDPVTKLSDQMVPRYVAFGLGVFPQCLKLFASHGIPYLQAIGGMYLASWVLFELLFLVADTKSLSSHRYPHRHESPWPQFANWHVQKYWGYAAVVIHAVFWSGLALPLSSIDANVRPVLLFPISAFAMLSVSLYWPYISSDSTIIEQLHKTFPPVGLSEILYRIPPPVLCSTLPAFTGFTALLEKRFDVNVNETGFATFIFGALIFDLGFSRFLPRKWHEYPVVGMSILLFVLHPPIYFYSAFEPTGSFRPEWLDVLG